MDQVARVNIHAHQLFFERGKKCVWGIKLWPTNQPTGLLNPLHGA